MANREVSMKLLNRFIKNEKLRHHCLMVAKAMEAYAKKLKKDEEEINEWWAAGLLHDLDWEKYPDEHPAVAVDNILPSNGYSQQIIDAVAAHAPERTGKEPETPIERYLFACDELSGFMHAVSLVRPNGFSDMKVKSVKKKLKDKNFAANVPRDHIKKGAEIIEMNLNDHIAFLIETFRDS